MKSWNSAFNSQEKLTKSQHEEENGSGSFQEFGEGGFI
jgi:hypothetical protein